MVKKTYIKISGLIFMLIGVVVIGLAIFLPRLLDVNAYRDDIIASLQKSINRQVSFGNGVFSMRFGPSFIFDNVKVKEPDGIADFIIAKRVTVRLALLPLLEKKVELKDLFLESPQIRLGRDNNGKMNIDDLLKPGPGGLQVRLKKIRIDNGEIQWQDLFIQKQGLMATFKNVDLSINNLFRDKKGHFKISAELASATKTPTLITLSGTAKLPPANVSLLETELNAKADIKQAQPGHFWPYYGRYLPFPNPGGQLDLATSFKGKVREFSAKGKLRLANTAVTWPTVFHHQVNPRLAQLDYELRLDKNSIDMPKLLFSADGFKISGSCRLLDITSPDLRIVAKATSEPFILENLRQWIPYGIIADDASEYIEQHITGGVFKLISGSLDGRISQILHMEKGTNYNILHIKGTVEKGIVSYGRKVPAFTNIKAGLEMLGKDFILSNVTGSYGNSPFKMQGKITDYPLDTPCQYPFSMEMTPRNAEVKWLAQLAGANRLEYGGASLLKLKGSGFIPSYHLTGEWDLKQAAYSFPGAVQKQAGLPNLLGFSVILGPKETRLTSLAYQLAPLNISASAQLEYGNKPEDKPHLRFELQTNQFMLSEALPILTNWQKYHLHGKTQAHITGSGNPADFTAMDYYGAIDLAAFSLSPGNGFKPVSNINGRIAFKGNNLETSSISVMYGSSLIKARGKLKNFSSPEAEISLSSPEFFLQDANLKPVQPHASIKNASTIFTVNDNRYTIHNFAGQFNNSNFSISGTYSGGKNPQANLDVTSSYLNLEDLLAIGKQEAQEKGSNSPKPDLKLKLTAETGKYGKLPFNRLNTTLSLEKNILYFHDLNATLFGGKIWAKGKITPAGAKGNNYELNFSLDRINGAHLFQALGISREITGTFNLHGELTAFGNTMMEIRKTALGSLQLRFEKGSLRKFNVFSKVFSILNFSQLLKLQLPDMVSGGMPYNEIKGSIAIKDGIASSQDLFIAGDALNISIVGAADIVKEELNLTIGVQPLQTVDKIVNRIPVVGWLLTGKNKALVTAYFEAKGKWSDPRVTAIPVKSMAKGVLNIFRRVFELPVRLFTDTGEVMLGQ